MSHRDSCPDRWTAHREGERAYERGSGSYSNPYDHWNGGGGCRGAEREWESGRRDAERRAEEQREQEAASRRARHQREEQEMQWAYEAQCRADEEQRYHEECQAELETEYYAELERDYRLDLAADCRWGDEGGASL